MSPLEQKQDELIQLLQGQVMDLSLMSKIELGDDVIEKWRQLTQEIIQLKDYVSFVSEVEEFNAIMGKPNLNK
jgi:hypothetical protein